MEHRLIPQPAERSAAILPPLPFLLRRQASTHDIPEPAVPEDPAGECRRRSPRRRVLRNALIVFRGGHCTLRCMILNTSDSGALVKPADVAMCPNTFVLRQQDGPSHHCEVAWRKGDMVGVRFL